MEFEISKLLIVIGTILLASDILGLDKLKSLIDHLRNFKKSLKHRYITAQYYFSIIKNNRNEIISIALLIGIMMIRNNISFLPESLVQYKQYIRISAEITILISIIIIMIKMLFKFKNKVGFDIFDKIILIVALPVTITIYLLYYIIYLLFFISTRFTKYFLLGLEKLLILTPKRILGLFGLVLIIGGTFA